jgi:hypothetical protein
MKANEFVRKFGMDSFKATMICPQFKRYNYAILYSDEVDFSVEFIEKHADYMFSTSEIKRLVESHDLVESYGGIDEAKDFISPYGAEQLNKKIYSPMLRIKQAIADVESCQ